MRWRFALHKSFKHYVEDKWRVKMEEPIPNIIAKLERGDIQIPELQRAFVWKRPQVELLIDSIYRGCPIGMLTLYQPPAEMGGREGVYWVLDGQQRLLSLQIIAKGLVKLEGDQRIRWSVLFNPETEKFICTEYALLGKWVKVSEIYEIKTRRELESYLSSWSGTPEEKERISTLWNALHTYMVPYRAIDPSVDLETLAEIFVRTNKAGTPVRGTDIFSTMIAVAQSGTAKELRNFVQALPGRWNEIQYGTVVKTFVAFLTDGKVKLASKVLDQASKLKAELKAKKTRIREIVRMTENNIREAINFLEQEWLRIKSPEWLPYENLLVVLSFYLGKRGKLPPVEKEGLLTWYVLATYFRRYSTSSETMLNEDLSVIAQGKGYSELIKKLEEKEGNLRTRIKEDVSRGIYHSEIFLYALLRKKEAQDFISKIVLDSSDVSVHHIFPRRIVGEEKAWDIGNITLTTLGTNNSLRAKKPEDYLPNLPVQIKKQHMIPENPRLWELPKYDEFIESRKELIKTAVEEFLANV